MCRYTSSAATLKQRRSMSCRRSSSGCLERYLHSQLNLPRVADALSDTPVETEERRYRQRGHVVGVVERVEHFKAWDHFGPGGQAERPLQAPVEREVTVVLPIPVATAIDTVQHAW